VTPRRPFRSASSGGAALWVGTLAYGGSTVALLAVLSRHSHRSSFSALAALLSLAFVVSLIPAGIQLRSASLVADGRPPPAMTLTQTILTAVVSLGLSPLFALLLHVPVLAAALVSVQMLVAIPLAAKQGALLALHRFRGLGVNLVVEGAARFAMGAIAGWSWGVTGLAAGICVGTAVALVTLPYPHSLVDEIDRPRTSLVDTSLSLALLGLYVQLDVLIAPSVLAHARATTYDLAAVPSKGVYLVLLAAGPLVFPFVRRHQGGRRLVIGAALITFAVGVLFTILIGAALPIIAVVLGRPRAGLIEFGFLGLAMALAGVSGIVTTAGVARGVKRPWPAPALGIVILLLSWPFRPDVMAFSVVVVVSQAVTTVLSVIICLWGKRREPEHALGALQEVESLAEAGDPLAPAQGMRDLPGPRSRRRALHASPSWLTRKRVE
jgi:hypothetical protein